MSESVLTRPHQELNGLGISSAVRELCAWAAAAQAVEAPVPALHPLASGDQLAVIGRDFLAWVEASTDNGHQTGALDEWRAGIGRLRSVT